MAYIEGEGRNRGTLFPVVLDDLVPPDPMCRVIDAFVEQLNMEKLKQNPEPEAGFMLVRQQALPAYNVQTAANAEHALIVAHAVVLDASAIRCLSPMAQAAKEALEIDRFNVVADAGYSNGEQAAHCEAVGMMQ